jgi:hypothetical protein
MKIRFLSCLLCLAGLLWCDSAAEAIFLKPDLEKVPVERLVKNLEAQAAKETKGFAARYNLARVHAMAYALKTETAEVRKKAQNEGAWFGPTPGIVPFKAVPTDDKEKAAAAKKHLDKAIAVYKEIVENQPMYLPAKLGLAWCQEQAGDKEAAIAGYREVTSKAWEKDHKAKVGPLGGNFVTKEAAGYLIPLLDAKKDENEIDDLKARVALLNKLPRPVTPIAIPLKDGLKASDLEDRNASVRFDADGSALDRKWTWISKDAAWLVHDPRHTGKITSGLQLFGNVSFWCFWDNGYQALGSLDDNGDGMLTGSELNGLALWHDANGNGICDEGEVRPLSYFGIVGLSCQWQTDSQHPDRIAFSPRGVVFQNGAVRPSFDLILQQR